MDVRHGPRKLVPRESSHPRMVQRQFRGFTPLTPFERIARGNSRQCISNFEGGWINSVKLVHLFEYAPGLLVLGALQVRVREIVHGVQLLVPRVGEMMTDSVSPRRGMSSEIRFDCFLPQT